MGTVLVFERTSMLTFLNFCHFRGEHARFVNIFVLIFIWIIIVYLLKLFCTATFPLCDTIVL
jgi:hypothetical protein